jgi:hypothetical protein
MAAEQGGGHEPTMAQQLAQRVLRLYHMQGIASEGRIASGQTSMWLYCSQMLISTWRTGLQEGGTGELNAAGAVMWTEAEELHRGLEERGVWPLQMNRARMPDHVRYAVWGPLFDVQRAAAQWPLSDLDTRQAMALVVLQPWGGW